MDIDVGSLRCMAPSLGIPPHRHYDPSDVEDAALRMDWAKFLFRAGYRLRYPQETTGTAVLLFHRFLIQERVGKHCRSRDVILTTCLFLAGKVTEAPRRLRDVINVLHMLTCTGQDEPPLLDKAYWTMKERIVEFEQVLLRTINFQVDPPDLYRLLLNYARSLRLDRAATRSAWGLINDVLFCPRALSAPPPAVVCASIRMAARVHGVDRRLGWFSPPLKKRKRGTSDSGAEGVAADETPVMVVTDGGGGSVGGGGVEAAGTGCGAGESRTESKHPLGSGADGAGGGGTGCAAVVEGDATAAEAVRGCSGSGDGGGDERAACTPWWGLFDALDEDIELVCSELLALYRAHADEDVINSKGVTGNGVTADCDSTLSRQPDESSGGDAGKGGHLNGEGSGGGAKGLESSQVSLAEPAKPGDNDVR